MKKRTILFLLWFLLIIKLIAQVPVKDDIQQILDQVYSNINTSYINTSYLYERTYHTSRMDLLDGIKDTVIGATTWRELYDELYRMSVNTPSLKHIDELSKGVEPLLSLNYVPLFIFYNNYNYINDNAL